MRFDDARDSVLGAGDDEDGDGFANDVDTCPGAYNEIQSADLDGDGVGDPCDPHPAVPGDRLIAAAFFEQGFGVWSPAASDRWSIIDGAAVTTAAADETVAQLSLAMPASVPTLQIAFVVEDYGPETASDDVLDVSLAFPGTNWVCRASGNGSLGIRNVALLENASPSGDISRSAIPAGMISRLSFTRDPSGVTCALAETSKSAPSVPAGSMSFNATIEPRRLRVGIAYALLYDAP